jgi:hypothetical protein
VKSLHKGLLIFGIVLLLIGSGAFFLDELGARIIGTVLIVVGALLLMQGAIYTHGAHEHEAERRRQERRYSTR